MKAEPISESEQDKIIEMPVRGPVKRTQFTTIQVEEIARAVAQGRLDDAQKILNVLKQDQRGGRSRSIPRHRRTRFFVKVAKETSSIRLAALVYLVTVKCVNFPPHKRGWHQNAEWYGLQLGLSRSGILKLIKSKYLPKWLTIEPTRRGLMMIPRAKSTAELKRSRVADNGHNILGFFCPSLARILGVNGSIIYRLMRTPNEETGGRRVLGPVGIARRLPWLTDEAARIELTRLYQRGILRRKTSQIGRAYLYYWRRRTKEDRAKFDPDKQHHQAPVDTNHSSCTKVLTTVQKYHSN